MIETNDLETLARTSEGEIRAMIIRHLMRMNYDFDDIDIEEILQNTYLYLATSDWLTDHQTPTEGDTTKARLSTRIWTTTLQQTGTYIDRNRVRACLRCKSHVRPANDAIDRRIRAGQIHDSLVYVREHNDRTDQEQALGDLIRDKLHGETQRTHMDHRDLWGFTCLGYSLSEVARIYETKRSNLQKITETWRAQLSRAGIRSREDAQHALHTGQEVLDSTEGFRVY